jgi:polar amino acid transport system substrate-binding protein
VLYTILKTRKWSSRWIVCICFLCIFSTLSACGNQTQNVKKQPVTQKQIIPPHSLLTNGTLTIGSYTNYLPQEFVDGTNHLTGFDIDLINELARRMGLHSKFVQLDFRNLLPSLQAKTVDVVISAMPITPEMQKKADFIPYFKGGESLLVANGNPYHIQTTYDLCGLSVGVQIGTLEETDLRQASNICQQNGRKAINTMALSVQTDVIHLLMAGHVVATYQDAPVSDYYIHQAPSLFHLGGPVTNMNVEGIAVHKGDTAMYKAIENTLEAIRKDGTYHYLIMKWGLTTGELEN